VNESLTMPTVAVTVTADDGATSPAAMTAVAELSMA
jgi:hypothetical protein